LKMPGVPYSRFGKVLDSSLPKTNQK